MKRYRTRWLQNALRISLSCRLFRLFRPGTCSGQTSVEYLLAIGVIAVAMALILLTGGLFEALGEVFTKFSRTLALPYP